MKLKRIKILLILLLLTGCTVNYDLDIKENGIFEETITGTVLNDELEEYDSTDINIYSYNLNSSTPLIRDEGVYTKNIIDKNEYKEFTFTYRFNKNYNKSSVINTCYDDVTFEETDDLYYINLEGNFNCLYTDKITINVTSTYAVLENNADKVDGNKYTWTITSSDDANIYMAISKNTMHENTGKKKKSSTFRIIGFIVLAALSLVTYFLYKKKNNSEY